MDWRKELYDTVIYIVVGLVLAFSLNLGLGYAMGTDKPVMAVVSSSMEPTFYKGDLVVVKGISPEEIAVGTIIVYNNPIRRIPVVHRVVAVEHRGEEIYFYTQGDNTRTNRYSDQVAGIAPPVQGEWIAGRVILVIPKLGWFKVLIAGI
ncbi:MAG: signal peptidase I [Candidatus Hydrothermarchaeota archaeon]